MLLVMEEPIMFIMLAAMGELELGEQVELFGEEVKDIARPLPTRLEAKKITFFFFLFLITKRPTFRKECTHLSAD